MAKKKVSIETHSYGIYTKWDNNSRHLPKILQITERIPAEDGLEFGYILNIRGAKGKEIKYIIHHPIFKNEKGEAGHAFTGTFFVNSNNYQFFLGDCIWEPIAEKCGPWRMVTRLDGKIIADKTFLVKYQKQTKPESNGNG